MNDETCCTPSDNKTGLKRKLGMAAMALKVLWVAPAAALLIVLIFLSSGRIHLSQTGGHFLTSLIYSAVIALPSTFLLTWISVRYTAKYPHLILLMRTLVLLFTATTGTLIAAFLLQVAGLVPFGRFWIEFWTSFPFSIVITLVIGLSVSSYETMRYQLQATNLELRTHQMEQERAYKLLAEARLSSLESRIHPHFLFNTLNSIAALIPNQPQRAEDTVGKLASLLRFSLNAHHAGLVPLSQELKIVRDYLEIEHTRFGQRLRYEIAVPAELDDVMVPPLALQSLVENSIKHVVAQRPQGALIQVSGARNAGRVRLEVIDDGQGFSLEAIAPEHGLGNLVARLALLFDSAGQLEVTRQNEKTVVSLSFPG